MRTNLKCTALSSAPAARKHLKIRAGALAVAGALALGACLAAAAEVTFGGFTDGCFGVVSCVPPTTPTTATQSTSFLGLTYNNSTFNVTTAAGFVSIGGSPGTPNLNNLGSFSLSGLPAAYGGEKFNVGVVFTAPAGVTPGNTLFTSIITGTVLSADHGGVFINFDNTVQHFTYGSGPTAGAFNFWINDVSIVAGRSAAVTGSIVTTAVPEPDTYAMMLAGLGLLGYIARHRTAKKVINT